MILQIKQEHYLASGVLLGGVLSFIDPWGPLLVGIALLVFFSYDFNKLNTIPIE